MKTNEISFFKLNDVPMPLGLKSMASYGRGRSEYNRRVIGYIPLCSMITGIVDTIQSISSVLLVATTNEYYYYDYNRLGAGREIVHIKLSKGQRAIVVGLCLATIARAFFQVFFLGWLFYPADLAFDKCVEMRGRSQKLIT